MRLDPELLSGRTALLGLLDLLDRLDRIISGSSVLLLPFFQHDHDPAIDPRPAILLDVFESGKTV